MHFEEEAELMLAICLVIIAAVFRRPFATDLSLLLVASNQM